MRRFKKILLLLGIVIVFNISVGWTAQPIVRIGILRGVTEAVIGTDNLFEVSFSQTEHIAYYNHPIKIKIKNGCLYVDTKKISSDRVTIRTDNGLVKINNKTYRGFIEIVNNAPKSFTVVEVLPLDQYIYGIIKHEISHKWPEDAIKAQVVVARTYALKSLGKHGSEGYDLCPTTHCQVYGGYESEDSISNRYVDETQSEILTYNGESISTPYHGLCGGRTEEPRFVWESKVRVPYLQSKRCQFCKNAKRYHWEASVERLKIESVLSANGFSVGKISNIKVTKRSTSGRVAEIKIVHKGRENIALKGNKFRLMMGADFIRSTNFKIKKNKNTYVFTGTGWGHGVGMCQEGAKVMAERGYTYKKILSFYYPGTEVTKWGF